MSNFDQRGNPHVVTAGGVFGRLVTSAFLSVAFYVLHAFISAPAALITGQVAGRQFENSDSAFLQTQAVFGGFTVLTMLMSIAFVVFLILIWWRYIKLGWTAMTAGAVALMLLAGSPQNAQAFFEKTDRTEIYTILPNESAFWIPDVGANKDTQARMDSEAYLNENKIAAKRFVIPHQKLTGSAGTSVFSGWDYFVPTGRLIIVDRTPFSREWVDAEDRGTSKSKEGFPCQTKEGLNVTAGVSIGTSVLEANAAKFLYRFGVKSPVEKLKGDVASIEHDGKIIFVSVYHGRSLKEVMDDVGRKKVQTLVCNEIGTRTFEKANEEMIKIMDEIEKKVKLYFDGVGITLDFIGWGDTFEFDTSVQQAVNRAYIAKQDEAIATILAPHIETIKALAAAGATRSFGEKTDGRLPTTYVGPTPDVAGPLLGLPNVQRTAPSPAPAPAR